MATSSLDPFFLLIFFTLFFTILPSSTDSKSLSTPSSPSPLSSPSPKPSPSSPSPLSSPSPKPSPSSPFPKPSPSSSSTHSILDPKQLKALQSLNIPTGKNPCSPSHNSTITCDSSTPFRHIVSLTLVECSDDVSLSLTAMKSLYTLNNLAFVNCPVTPIRLPTQLALNLKRFTCVNSLKKLSGVWISKLQNVTDLTVRNVKVVGSGPYVVLNSMIHLNSVTISNANLTGYLPKHWHSNLSYIDLSSNMLKGKIPVSLTELENLEFLNLSMNLLNGTIPGSFGDLSSLQNVSLSSNSLSGTIPDSIVAIPGLVHLDLGSNKLNGTIPKFISEMKRLKYLNLEKNNFHGVLPFNASFIKKLAVLKVGENSNLCYNHSTLSSKVKLGIARCDKHGLPMSPPASKEISADDNDDSDDYADDENVPKEHSHGPSKVVLGICIALSSIVFLIIFLILLAKCCK